MKALRTLGFAILAVACGRPAPAPAPSPIQPAGVPAPTPIPVAADSVPPQADSIRPPAALVDSAPKRPGTPVPARPAARQGTRCLLDLINTPDTRMLSVRDPVSQKYTTYFGGGFIGNCRGQNIRIASDSVESYEQSRLYHLIGRVRYREDRVTLDADRATYFQAEERLVAEGNVVITMKDSSSMTGPRAEYFRPVRGIRATSKVIATARPTLRLYEKDSLGRRGKEPVVLVADNIVGEGESLFVAQGKVILDRTDLQASADSAILDNVGRFSRLMRGPVVESKGTQPFTLKGLAIDIFGNAQAVDRVVSRDSASAVNKDMTLTAQTLDMRVNANRLQRVFAFGEGRAVAVTPGQRISAESLDVNMPDQRIREMRALRAAHAESSPDTLKVKTDEKDWMRGALIVARFDTTVKDTTQRPRIVDLVADGSAASWYQVPSNKGRKDRPGLSYVRGRRITVDFRGQEVNLVTVEDSVYGVYLEAVEPDTLKSQKAKAAARRPTKPAAAPARGRPGRGPGR